MNRPTLLGIPVIYCDLKGPELKLCHIEPRRVDDPPDVLFRYRDVIPLRIEVIDGKAIITDTI